MASVTAAVIRHFVAGLLGDSFLGTATSAAAASLTDNIHLLDSADYHKGVNLKVYSAAANGGQERRVTASTALGVLNVTAWTTGAPTAPILYELHSYFTAAEYDRFVADGFRTLTRDKHLVQRKMDTTVAWVLDQWEYDIPAGFVALDDVEVQTVTGVPGSDDYQFIPWEAWDVRRDGASTRKLVFQQAFGQYTTGYLFRLRGWQEFTLPVLDADTYNIDPAPVAFRAAQYAAEALMAREQAAKWQRLADHFKQRADELEQRISSGLSSRHRSVEVA